MASEKEASFPIEDFSGINRNVVREDLSPTHIWSSKNMWEKTLGILETRGGSEAFAEYPSNITKITGITKLYKGPGDHARIGYIQCAPQSEELPSLPTIAELPSWMTVEFTDYGYGYWNNNHTISTLDWSGKAAVVYIRLVGYGIDKWYSSPPSDLDGYTVDTAQTLTVNISDFNIDGDTNYTGYEVYCLVDSRHDGSPVYSLMWCGYKRLIGVESATYYHEFLPLGQNASGSIADGTEIGETKRRIVSATGYQDGGGLVSGKTYYIAIIPHHIKLSDSGAVSRCSYRGAELSRTPGTDILAVTVPGEKGQTGSILIEGISANTVTGLILFGESPELLRPLGIYNEMPGPGGETSTIIVIRDFDVTGGANYVDDPEDDFYGFILTSYAKESPALVDIVPTQDGHADYNFRISAFSINDMLVRIDDNGSVWPIFCSRFIRDVNSNWAAYGYTTDPAIIYVFKQYYIGENAIPTLGRGARPSFEPHGDLMYFVNGFNPDSAIGTTGDQFDALRSRNGTNYMVSDGGICGPVIEEFKGKSQTCTFTDTGDIVTSSGHGLVEGDPVHFTTITTTTGITVMTQYYANTVTADTFKLSLTRGGAATTFTSNGTGVVVIPNKINMPVFRYIKSFQGSILLAGGQTTVDRDTGDSLNASKTMYFSNALVPNDFIIAGGSLYQTLAVQDDSEDISGLGIYSNTSTEVGPFAQLVIGKKNKIYVVSNLPGVVDGSIDPNVRVVTLSGRVGLAGHFLIENTRVGTILVAVDNVFLLRENGEPTPVGQEISPILKGADLSNGFCTIHDDHVKISFYHEDYDDDDLGPTVNNVELWLNINKMVEQKGKTDWVGPMVGYSNQYAFVEDRDGDGLKYNDARDRFCVDGNAVRTFIADVTPDEFEDEVFDFGIHPVESELETKDYEISQQDNNWSKLIKRAYWKIRSNSTSNDPAQAFESTYLDGNLFEEKELEFYGNDDDEVGFNDQPLKLVRVFPTGRPRGRTVRKKLRTSQRIGIAGFQLNYAVERRRL